MSTESSADASASWPVVSPGYSHVPPGHLASVVTFLEMRARPVQEAASPPAGWALQRMRGHDHDVYRRVFAAVGEHWLWFSRLTLDDDSLRAILDDEAVHAYAVRTPESNEPVGLLELDFRDAGACELSFLGVTPAYTGRGIGRWLMTEVMERAWSRADVHRVHVHTCTLDHPGALTFYLRSGFTAVARAIEVAPDPRTIGLLPSSAAPHIPLAASP